MTKPSQSIKIMYFLLRILNLNEHILCDSSYIQYIQNSFYLRLEFETRGSGI